ncbi:unnamed protein product [Aphis gossypii]|uniref:Uncharacterized protein n=1 Tax=Aphis gossypii TaxID=80765 RepID=A0A9P0NKQ9_APHGO|nr:unnamed protein product [Aphis gossypii]
MSVHARDEPVRFSGDGEPRVRFKFGRHRVRVNLVRAVESNYICWVASNVDELIGPVALLDPVVVSQTGFAGQRVRRSVFAFDVVGAASGTVREQTELVFASGRTDRHNFGFAISALDGPVVVAVVVGGAFAVVQQTVAALFECQSAVRAQVELIAIIGVGVRLFAVLFRTLRRAVFLAPDHCCFEQEHCGKRPKDVHRGGLCGILPTRI